MIYGIRLTDYCPACDHWGYKCEPGEYDEEGKKLSPDYFQCSHCGFSYEEHIKTSESEEAKWWRERKPAERK